MLVTPVPRIQTLAANPPHLRKALKKFRETDPPTQFATRHFFPRLFFEGALLAVCRRFYPTSKAPRKAARKRPAKYPLCYRRGQPQLCLDRAEFHSQSNNGRLPLCIPFSCHCSTANASELYWCFRVRGSGHSRIERQVSADRRLIGSWDSHTQLWR